MSGHRTIHNQSSGTLVGPIGSLRPQGHGQIVGRAPSQEDGPGQVRPQGNGEIVDRGQAGGQVMGPVRPQGHGEIYQHLSDQRQATVGDGVELSKEGSDEQVSQGVDITRLLSGLVV